MRKPLRQSFLVHVRIRWWAVTVLSIGAVVALYMALQAASIDMLDDLLNINESKNPVLWIIRIWFGIGVLVGFLIRNLYITNADTEVWAMANIELTKRISRYEAELEVRESDEEWHNVKRITKKELRDRADKEEIKKAIGKKSADVA